MRLLRQFYTLFLRKDFARTKSTKSTKITKSTKSAKRNKDTRAKAQKRK